VFVSSVGSRLVLLHLLAIAVALLLTSCGESGPVLARGDGQRAGADRTVPAGSLPRAPASGQYDGALVPTDETRGEKLGAVVPEQGGQKAQLDAREKEERAAKAARDRERAEQAQQAKTPHTETPASAPPQQ